MIARGYRIVEVPIGYAPRSKAEGKKIGARDWWRALRTFWRFPAADHLGGPTLRLLESMYVQLPAFRVATVLRHLGHAAIAACVVAGLASCGGDNPNDPSPNPGNQAPTVAAVAPAAGTTLGGTTITVTGTNFAAGATVTVGGTAATDVAVQGPTSLTARTPQHAAGPGDVVVTVAGRSGTRRTASCSRRRPRARTSRRSSPGSPRAAPGATRPARSPTSTTR